MCFRFYQLRAACTPRKGTIRTYLYKVHFRKFYGKSTFTLFLKKKHIIFTQDTTNHKTYYACNMYTPCTSYLLLCTLKCSIVYLGKVLTMAYTLRSFVVHPPPDWGTYNQYIASLMVPFLECAKCVTIIAHNNHKSIISVTWEKPVPL